MGEGESVIGTHALPKSGKRDPLQDAAAAELSPAATSSSTDEDSLTIVA
jgi:hypothetical protein